jgi:phenylpropionate dioxygenase-like ring-hydroxylating dioxygenase large terminal subunit
VSWAADVHAAPIPVTLLGTALVLWHSGGDVRAAYDRCPHRGTALSLGEVDDEGCLVCPYHGWLYDQSGACVRIPQLAASVPIPPRARLAMVRSEERHGLVWVCLGEPVEPIPAFPEFGDEHYRHVPCPTYRWATSPGRMVENFTDFGHLGYLHDGLLGTKDDLVVPAHKVDQVGGALRYTLSMQVPNTNDQFSVTDLRGERGLQTNRYVLTLPYTIHLACTYEDTGSHRTLFFSVQPHGDGTCTGYCYQSRDFDLDGVDEDYAQFQEVVAGPDPPRTSPLWRVSSRPHSPWVPPTSCSSPSTGSPWPIGGRWPSWPARHRPPMAQDAKPPMASQPSVIEPSTRAMWRQDHEGQRNPGAARPVVCGGQS